MPEIYEKVREMYIKAHSAGIILASVENLRPPTTFVIHIMLAVIIVTKDCEEI